MAKVILEDFSYSEVTEEQVEVLLQKRKIIGFQRSGLWIAAPAGEALHRGVQREAKDSAAGESAGLKHGGTLRRSRKVHGE